MKKLIALLLTLALVLTFTACGGKTSTDEKTSGSDAQSGDSVATTAPTAQGAALGLQLNTGMKEKQDQMEYSIYCDLFYNENGAAYENMKYTKDGVFAILEDAYSGKTRYYVWGYADNTKCCDYQWEFVMPKGAEIPEAGSYVTMTGQLTKSDEALDGYWFTDVQLTVEEPFAHAGYDYDLTTDSPTLARVQIQNMESHMDQFNGKTVRIYGRAMNLDAANGGGSVQHPYYDGAWSIDFNYNDKIDFAIGDDILVEGPFTVLDAGCYIDSTKITKLS